MQNMAFQSCPSNVAISYWQVSTEIKDCLVYNIVQHAVLNINSKLDTFFTELFLFPRTKETLATGHFMSVINILMQLRKVCNHPNLFDPRPITSPFQMEGLTYTTPSEVLRALEKDPLEVALLHV